jgi:hypothetical protein
MRYGKFNPLCHLPVLPNLGCLASETISLFGVLKEYSVMHSIAKAQGDKMTILEWHIR